MKTAEDQARKNTSNPDFPGVFRGSNMWIIGKISAKPFAVVSVGEPILRISLHRYKDRGMVELRLLES